MKKYILFKIIWAIKTELKKGLSLSEKYNEVGRRDSTAVQGEAHNQSVKNII